MDERRGVTRHPVDYPAVRVEGESSADGGRLVLQVYDRLNDEGDLRRRHWRVDVARLGRVRGTAQLSLGCEVTRGDREPGAPGLDFHGRDVVVGTNETVERGGRDRRRQRRELTGEFGGRAAEYATYLGEVARRPLREQKAVRPDLVGRGAEPVLPRLEHRGRRGPRVLERKEGHLGHCVDVELERSRHAEIAPAPALARPQEVRVRGGIGGDEAGVGRDETHRAYVVRREAVLAAKDAKAATEGQSRDAHGRARASGK